MNFEEVATNLLGKRKDELLKELYELSVEYRKEEELYSILIQLHNEKKIDVISAFEQIQRDNESYDFFMLQRMLERILPKINYDSVESVMKVLKRCMILVTGNMTSGLLVNPFIEFCKQNEKRIEEALGLSLKSLDKEIDFISIVLLAGLEVDFDKYYKQLEILIGDLDEIVQIGAVRVLGQFYSQSETRNIHKSFELLKKVIHETEKVNIKEVALKSLCKLLILDVKLEKEGIEIIEHVLFKPTDTMLYNIAELLFFYNKNLSWKLKDYLWSQLKAINPKHNDTIRNIDHALYSIAEENKSKAIQYLEKILLENLNGIGVENFCVFKSFLMKNEKSLNYLVTKWLLSKNITLCKYAYELIPSSENGRAISIDKRLALLLKKEDYLFLAKKSCGYLFTKPVSALSYLVSLLESSPFDKGIIDIEELIYDPILINYSGKTREYLYKIYSQSSAKVRNSLDRVTKRLDKYLNEIKSINYIAEFEPTSKQREAYSRYWNDSFSAKDLQPKGFFSSFFKTQVLLYGSSSINYIIHNPNEKGQRQEVFMHPQTISTELPRMSIINPIVLDYRLTMFRVEGCEK